MSNKDTRVDDFETLIRDSIKDLKGSGAIYLFNIEQLYELKKRIKPMKITYRAIDGMFEVKRKK